MMADSARPDNDMPAGRDTPYRYNKKQHMKHGDWSGNDWKGTIYGA